MSAAIVVGLLLAAGEPHSTAGKSLIDAATEALGPSVSLVVKQVRVPSAPEALRLEAAQGAAAVAAVSWTTAPPTASILIHLSRDDRWISRRLDFLGSDTPSERGRTVGFTLASMLLFETETVVPEEPPDEAAAGPERQALPDDARRRDDEGPPATNKPPPAPDPPTEAVGATTAEGVAPSSSVELAMLGVRGVGGPATGWGGAIHAEHGIGGAFHLRGGVSLRVGEFPSLNGDDRVLVASAGATWRPFDTSPTSRMGLGGSLEGGLLYHDFSHEVSDQGGDVHSGRALPAVLATIEGTWRAAAHVDALFGISSEVAFGTTQVVVARDVVGTVPVFRLGARLGIRLRMW